MKRPASANKQASRSGTSWTALRAKLDDALRENKKLRSENEKLREATQLQSAENERLRAENVKLLEEKQSMQDQIHRTVQDRVSGVLSKPRSWS